jgi:D-lyxose ketol-isomerase
MKRSEINKLILDAKDVFKAHGWMLPPFAEYRPGKWSEPESGLGEIKRSMLGWDITDFGGNDFYRMGLILFTMRNANLTSGDIQPYAEKLLLVREGQETPCHFHFSKMEDIINRAGGNLMVKLYESTPDEALSDSPMRVKIDGYFREYEAGAIIRLPPGSSVTMHRRLYHSFWAEEGGGAVVAGEVSTVNDDKRDNRFLPDRGRFPAIEEDELPVALLVSDYKAWEG